MLRFFDPAESLLSNRSLVVSLVAMLVRADWLMSTQF